MNLEAMELPRNSDRSNPIAKANFISRLFLAWFWPIFRIGYKKVLTVDDLWDPPKDDKAKDNVEKLETEWRKQIPRTNVGINTQTPESVQMLPNINEAAPTGSYLLFRALFRTFGNAYLLAWPMLILTDCGLKVIQPWFMLRLVRTFIEEPRDEAAQYFYAAGVCISTFLITMTSNPCLFYLGRVCQRCRIALASLIQRKVLRLSASTQQTNQGQIANLITNDTFTIEQSLLQLPYLVVAPLQLIIYLWFLFAEFGWSSFAGLGFIFLYMPFQYVNGTLSTQYRGMIGTKTDERVRVLSEVIDAIHSVKMYAWENVFQYILKNRRKEEVTQLRKRSRLHAFQMSVFLTSSRVVPFLTFTAFLFLGGPLTADRVFYAVAVYNMMTHYMVFMLPGAIRASGEIKGSLQRLQQCIHLPEKPCNNNSYTQINGTNVAPRVILSNVSASWKPDDSLVLRNLQCDEVIQGNKLIVVVGKVGCGKSSLLHLILNELYIRSGSVMVTGAISYAPQKSNLFPGSIRTNVLNGAEFDEERYKAVLEAACLDIKNTNEFKKSDSTRVAELSGGQKARVNLARAMYYNANVYLLDDPLSSVDASVSRSIFDNAIKGFLGNTLRVLVTNNLQFLDEADHVIVMQEHEIKAIGSPPEMMPEIIEYLGERTEVSVDASLANGFSKNYARNTETTAREETIVIFPEDDGGDETQGVGAVGFRIYWNYFNAGKSLSQLLTYFVIFIIAQVFTTLIEYWLTLWTNAEEKMYEASLTPTSTAAVNNSDLESDDSFTWQGFEHFLSNLDNLEQNYYFYIYLILTTIVFLTNLAKAVAFFQYCMRISTNMHEKMLQSLLHAQPSFFDANASGVIMNRFTKDVATIDELIPFQFFDMWTILLQVITVILLIIFAIWYSVVPILLFLFMLGYVRRYYVTTSRDLKRIDGKTRSPVISHVQATFGALVTMRALGAEGKLSSQFDSLQDINTSATISFLAASQCFNIWIEMLATVLLVFVAFGFLLAQNYLGMTFPGGNVGLAICSAMSLTIWLQYGMKVSANVENLMVSVERAMEYTKLPSEASRDSETEHKPPSNWPDEGNICFQNASLTYKTPSVGDKNNHTSSNNSETKQAVKNGEANKDDQIILKELSFDVTQNEKIGIVGKTGAGKSSVLRALFRMTELKDGTITVDGRDIRKLGLHDLRNGMVIIPQEPKLFKGTLKFNLDPRTELQESGVVSISEQKMKEILNEIGLQDKRLDFEVENEGGNLSVGERQLVSIARALLLKRRIVCLDEATAHIDPGTDEKIQNLLRKTLKDSTTITIAHRLGTVIESDKILVLDEGENKEYDHAYKLLQNPKGLLKKMVENTGNDATKLETRAKESWQSKAGKGAQ